MEKAPQTLKDIEAALAKSGSPYLQGEQPSFLDAEAFQAASKDVANLDATKFPHTFAWFSLISMYSAGMQAAWGQPGAAVKPSAGKKAAPAAKQDGGAKAEKKGDKKEGKKGKKEKEEAAPGEKKLTAKELRLLKKQEEAAAADAAVDPNDPCAHKFGNRELNRSQGDPEARFTKKFTKVEDLTPALDGQEVIVRARVHNARAKGKVCFIVLREVTSTVQAGLFVDDNTSKGMVSWSGKIPKESIVEVKARVAKVDKPITACTQQLCEL